MRLHTRARDIAPDVMQARLFIILPFILVLTGCVHRIEVNPVPSGPASTTIPRSLQLIAGPLALEGPDHMPGITLLNWAHRDLSQALLRYAQQRDTFGSVSTDPADLTLRITTKLSMASRDRYRYRIRLQSDMSETGQLIKTYLVEQDAMGSWARWTTASDRDPIEAALQLALDDLFAQIEGDRALYVGGKGQPAR